MLYRTALDRAEMTTGLGGNVQYVYKRTDPSLGGVEMTVGLGGELKQPTGRSPCDSREPK